MPVLIFSEQQILVSHRAVPVHHTLYLSNIAPCNFFFFPILKNHFESKFENVDGIKRNNSTASCLIKREVSEAL